ncbi:recombination mediator RecR [Roseinatronobacter sp. NSM]|uniref:recombination mediator RecR n=1 Tax=Roseinatronobacter sp. NSM TaxID=3457785 RepID=UPI00403677EA
MDRAPNDIEALIAQLARLPGLGPRSARRLVLHLIQRRDQSLRPLLAALDRVTHSAQACAQCGNISTAPVCAICTDETRRATGELCVVEDVADLWAMERGGVFKGQYHVLGGTLSALDGIEPDDLRIPQLVARVGDGGAREVILALGATVDGQTTAHYIADVLTPTGVKITALAQGVPMGGELDYLDDGTIGAALRARKDF